MVSFESKLRLILFLFKTKKERINKMNKLKLNETPVRTSRNFGINNIEIENIDFPKNLKEFKNIEILKSSLVVIDEDVSNEALTYGNGKILEKNIFENANHKLRIIANEKEENIKITYCFDDDNLELINHIEVIANGNLDLIVEYQSNTNQECFHNGLIRTIAKENAKVSITIVNLLNTVSNHFEAIENQIYDNANVRYTMIDIGGKNSITNYYSDILGDKAKNDLKTIYLGIENELKDINYIVELKGKNSSIDIDVQGALKDNSKKHFKGTIDFKRGAKKSKGNENEYCMLLSDTAKSLALPMLLCTEDDVEGNHSTASGKVDKEELFYIMSRGISYKEAIKLIVKARFNKILERITDEEVKDRVLQEIDRRLG